MTSLVLHHDDPFLRRRIAVDVVDAGASATDDLERRRLDDVGRHLGRRAHDQTIVFLKAKWQRGMFVMQRPQQSQSTKVTQKSAELFRSHLQTNRNVSVLQLTAFHKLPKCTMNENMFTFCCRSVWINSPESRLSDVTCLWPKKCQKSLGCRWSPKFPCILGPLHQ